MAVTSICVGCGLCCDGTMYSTVDMVGEDRADVLTQAGITLSTRENTQLFRQPCAAFSSGCCSVYANRPRVCQRYRCYLLRRHEVGEVAYDDASALIARTIDLRNRVRVELGNFVESRQPQSLNELYRLALAKLGAEPNGAAARRQHAPLLMSVVALRAILKREFEQQDASTQASEAATDRNIAHPLDTPDRAMPSSGAAAN